MANDTKASNQPNLSETRSLLPAGTVSPDGSDLRESTAAQKTTADADDKAETTNAEERKISTMSQQRAVKTPADREAEVPLPFDTRYRQEVSYQLDNAIDQLEALLKDRESDFIHPLGTILSPTQANSQYTIPLDDEADGLGLDSTFPELSGIGNLPLTTPEWEANAEKVARFRPILNRLANELEVIIQTGVDEALKLANQKIMHRVHNHVAIVLPEILEEIEHEQSRERKFPEGS